MIDSLETFPIYDPPGSFTWLEWFRKIRDRINGGLFPSVNSSTVGAVTINTISGRVNIAAGASTVVVTNLQCNLNSHIFCSIATNDATAILKNVIPATGSFTIRTTAAVTANTAVNFFITN